jgi:hypothetical protein
MVLSEGYRNSYQSFGAIIDAAGFIASFFTVGKYIALYRTVAFFVCRK